jgi:hypothetical protein
LTVLARPPQRFVILTIGRFRRPPVHPE